MSSTDLDLGQSHALMLQDLSKVLTYWGQSSDRKRGFNFPYS